ncbi:MAG TPA: c-type cytochrome [Steroidobacteraceae bacterium]|nr:c-type cytochrome [Steroidobacteraceae bacterium]HNS28351.1 c-type cytochrome [Steroidobacteraceae bacterium]
MSLASRTATAFALATFLAGSVGVAHAQGNAERGKVLAQTCLGCHAVENYKNSYPTYPVPKLRGQHAEYLEVALRGYQAGERSHATMHAHAASLSEQEIADIAAFLGGEAVQPTGKPAAANAPEAAAVCVACHGNDGVGVLPAYPTLTGQHIEYLKRALTDYKSGARKNPIMAGFVATLSAKDIEALAAYYGKMGPGLETVELRKSRFSAR